MKKINIIYDEKGIPSISGEVVVAGEEVEVSVNILPIYKVLTYNKWSLA